KEFKPVPEYYRLPGATVTPGQDSDTKYRHAVSVEEIKQKELEKGFLLSDVPFRVTLCKIEEEKYGLLVCNHHILYDGWSNGIILKEFFEAYNVLSAGNLLPKKIKSRFKEFVKWIQRRDLNKQEQYWKNYLNGVDFPTELPVKAPPDSKGTGNRFSKCYHLELSSEINAGFDDFIKEQRVTLAALMYCAWGILLQKYADSEDVVLGTTVSGRTAKIKGIENNVGLFINTLPLRVKNRAKEPVSALLSAVNQDLQEREAFENSPLVEIMQCSGLAAGVELFDSLMVIENYPLDTAALSGDFQVKSYSTVEMTNYDLTVAITRREQLEVDFNYRGDVLEQETVKRIASHFSNILKEITGSPGKNAREIELLSQEEKNEILRDFNDTAFDIGSGTTITGLFEHQVEKTPEAISIIGPGGLQGALTYRELDNLAAELALILQEKGVGREQIAALMVDDPLETAVGILGILKAGAAYLPIDPAYPEERIRYMAADSAAKLLLKGKSIAVDIPGLAMWNLSIADFKNSPAKGKQSIREFSERELSKKGQASKRANKTNTSVNKSDRNLAGYVIYTSGTTGRPRGVLVEHGSAVNTLVYRKQAYGLDGAATLLQLFSFAFDGFVTSFFTPLISGSRLVMPGRDQLKEIFRLVDAIIEYGVTHMLCVPPLFGSILQHMPVGGAKTLRVVTLAGDKASIELVEAARAKNENLEIVNEYGITEAAVMSTICRHQEKKETITIGKPTGNTTIRIIGHHRALQPVGVPGELCIAGAGLARGYLNNPQLTAEKFAPNPHPSPSFPNNHYPVTNNSLYHTGDLARWLPGGYIEFLGRRDHQVKIRGFRIETAEIESQLLSVDGIKEAVVTCRKDGAGEAFLCAYVVKEARAASAENIKALLASQLPSYMVPAALISLPALPLTPNGKIDRKGLPDPEFAGGTAFVAPRDVLEQRLVAIWSRVLSVDEEKIGIDDDFFRLGGHSLKATTCSLKIHKVLNVKIPVDTFFKNPTVRKLAAQVREAKQELYVSIDESEKREYYPLSASQRRLYITQHMEVEGVGYNIRALVRLQGELSLNKTGEICKGLIERHESLRTSFVMIEDKPVQRVHKAEDVLFAVEYFDAGDLGDFRVKGQAPREMDIILRDFERPFDLAMAP
ncbi:MAG: amino acid adenylation domain-containing protein, partial [bacterium]|nr:amino acid adenylation domain-containing protein [bacterium]